jgi:tetratricopeptide (TPR) repeat protein
LVAAIAATLSLRAARAADADLKACESATQQDAKIDCYTRIIEDRNATPASRVAAYSRRSTALRANGEYERAIDDATKALEIDPKYHDGYRWLLA